MPNNTSSVPTAGPASIRFDEMAALATRMREQAIDNAAMRVLAAVVGSKAQVYQAPPGALPPDRLFVVFVAPEVMARLTTLTKGA